MQEKNHRNGDAVRILTVSSASHCANSRAFPKRRQSLRWPNEPQTVPHWVPNRGSAAPSSNHFWQMCLASHCAELPCEVRRANHQANDAQLRLPCKSATHVRAVSEKNIEPRKRKRRLSQTTWPSTAAAMRLKHCHSHLNPVASAFSLCAAWGSWSLY